MAADVFISYRGADRVLARRTDEQLLRAAYGIARDANLTGKMRAYEAALQRR